MNTAIIGLGYVGLPLSLHFAKCGYKVLGLDIDEAKVKAINEGRSYISHIDSRTVAALVADGMLSADTNFARISDVEAVLICVPTPLNKNREPDLSYVLSTGRTLAPHLRAGMLVVLESTTYPGTTEDELRIVLEEGSGLRAGVDFHLAYSPEREDPGNPAIRFEDVPKVVGGYTHACVQRAEALYSKAAKTVVKVSSCRAAEATKLLENIFRCVNIALVNELKVVYTAMGIDIWEVLGAAKSKPFGYMPFYPGLGMGGHCLSIDPFYLTWKAREYGQPTRFIELAGEINTGMPEYVVKCLSDALNAQGKPVNGSRVLIIGLAYKPNVDDDRESPSYELMDMLSRHGATVEYYDPHIPIIRPSRAHSRWVGVQSVPWERETISAFDVVVIATAHDSVNYKQLAKWAQNIVDTRNALANAPVNPWKLWKA